MAQDKKGFIYDAALHPQVVRWLRQLAERQPAVFLRLTQENRSRLRAIFGAPTQVVKEARREWVWKVERGSVVAWFLSGDMGTSLHMYYPGTQEAFINDKEIGLQANNLLNELSQSLVHSRIPFGVEKKENG